VVRGLSPEGRARLEHLAARHALDDWEACCSRQEWRESLYVLDVLDAVLPRDLPPGRGLDVGSKNGCTLPGLATASPRGWDLVELDAHRRYLWGATRRAYGEALAACFPDCRYHAADVLTLPGPWAVVTWFLPFLTEGPLRAWGLPARFLQPERLLEHVCRRVLPGGALLVVNQGEAEAALQATLFERLGLSPRALGPVESPLSPFRLRRHGFLWRPPPSKTR
jgi:SAM-dependent methyltransferase